MPRSIEVAALGIALALAACTGCSKNAPYPQATVIGLVTVDGTPAPRGAITFSPTKAGQGPVTGAIIEEGRFRCEHVPLGPSTVTFTLQAAEPTRFTDITGAVREVPQNILPWQYQAGVPAEVQSGENQIDFPLTRLPSS
jgi:hypothetical protein